ncbi:MAG TPA: glycoside hydrolase family 16 protein [Nocardioidaceae bacterium]|nr:glycoside hydrolase family 16 protein [Nocardioidaceae bacterium]
MRLLARLLLLAVVLVLLAASGVVAYDKWAGRPTDAHGVGEDPVAGTDSPTPPGGRLSVLPPVAQPGNSPARADRTGLVVSARFTEPQQGGVVLLERRSGATWKVVASAEQDRSGVAMFADVRSPGKGKGTDYRATALGEAGDPEARTNVVNSSAWRLVFGDQFDGDALDMSKWMYRQVGLYNESGMRECSMSDESAVSVSGGTLKLQVQEDPAKIGVPCYTEDYGTLEYYLNGHIATEGIFNFTHGVAAARVKFPQGRGQHGAFWLQRSGVTVVPGEPKSSGAEIDIVEYFGEGFKGGGLASFLYYLNAGNENEKVGGVWPKATRQLPPGDAWWRSYHVFSVEWTPKQYVFRVDGRETFRTKEGVSGVPQFLVLSLLSSDWELPKLDRSTLPTTMETDWVRVWQRDKGRKGS